MPKLRKDTTDELDDELEDGLEGEESEEGESGEESSEESADKPEGEETSEGEEGAEESEEDKAKKAEHEALKQRRKREKKLKQQQRNRERLQSQNLIVNLQETVKNQGELINKLAGNFAEVDTRAIDNEMREMQSVYQEAMNKQEQAITANDGQSFRKAKEIADKAWARYNQLELSKRNVAAKKPNTREAASTTDARETAQPRKAAAPSIQLGDDAIKHGHDFQRKNPWYQADQTGRATNFDSKVVQLIDQDLYNEGYDPETSEYWDELKDRVKERLPHRFKNQATSGTKPKVITGGGGGSSNEGGRANVEKSLPREFIDNLKMAGMWDDPKKKKAAIDDYLKNKKKG